MKIAHVIDYFQPLLGYQETYLAKEQMKLGHSVKVFTSDRYFPFIHYEEIYQNKFGNRIKATGEFKECDIDVLRLPVKFELFARVWLLGLEQEIINYSPDYILVHSLMSISAYKIAVIKFEKKVAIVYDDHMSGIESESMRQRAFRYFYCLFFKKKIVRTAKGIACVTRSGIRFLESKLGIPASLLHYIPLGYDPLIFYKSEELRKNGRNSLKFDDHSILGLYTGKITSAKGINELIDALKKIFVLNSSFRFVFVGNGDASIIDRIQNELPKDKIVYINFVSPNELCTYYNAADFAIWPNGITASHIEANACGLPIIVSPWKASKERVVNGNGIALEESSSEKIFNTIFDLITRPERFSNMSKEALKCSDLLTWKALSEKFLSI